MFWMENQDILDYYAVPTKEEFRKLFYAKSGIAKEYNEKIDYELGKGDESYYQTSDGKNGFADKVKNIFKPVMEDVKKFTESLKKALKGELQPQTMLRVVSSTPEVYKRLGVEDKALNLPQNVLKKINVGKHEVPLMVVENLPELVSNPLVVLDSKTEQESFVSVLDEVDKNGNMVVAIIKPTGKAYNVIPSVYGKEQINELIKSSNVRYVNDIEKPATASIDLSSLQLRGGDSARGNNNNILQKSDIVNSGYFQTERGQLNPEAEQKQTPYRSAAEQNRRSRIYRVMGQYEYFSMVVIIFYRGFSNKLFSSGSKKGRQTNPAGG